MRGHQMPPLRDQEMRGQRPPLRLLLLRRLAAQHAKPSQHSGVLGFTTSRFTTLEVNPPNQATRATDVQSTRMPAPGVYCP